MSLRKAPRRRPNLSPAPAAAALCVAAIGSPAHASLDASAGINDKGTGIAIVTHDGSPAQAIGVYGGINGDAHATASYGILHAYAHGFANNNAGYAYVGAEASFTDSITITGGTGTGYFNSDFTVDGTLLNGGGFPTAGISWSNSAGNVTVSPGTHTYHGTQSIQFTFGVPFTFTADLTSLVTWGNAGGFGEGLADFGNTAKLTGITVVDSNFNDVTNFTATGSTGVNYAAVPEPTSACTLLAGVLVPLIRRRR